MKYEIISFDKIDESKHPDSNWAQAKFSPLLGEIIHMFYKKSSFDVFDEYKEIIRSVKNKKHHTPQEQAGILKIQKLFYLKSEFDRDKKFYNPLVLIPQDDKYLVHPGKDRYLILKSSGFTEYSFLVCDKKEATNKDKLDEIKYYHTDNTIIKFNENNFSTVTVIDKQAFEDWL